MLPHRLHAVCEAFGFDPALLAQLLRVLDSTEAGALAQELRRDGIIVREPTPAVTARR